jgi:hypothetical protein
MAPRPSPRTARLEHLGWAPCGTHPLLAPRPSTSGGSRMRSESLRSGSRRSTPRGGGTVDGVAPVPTVQEPRGDGPSRSMRMAFTAGPTAGHDTPGAAPCPPSKAGARPRRAPVSRPCTRPAGPGRRARSTQALALRSKIVLACADGAENKSVAAQLGCAPATVGKWRARFVNYRLDGLTDEARRGRPATVTADQIEDVLVTTSESTPADAATGVGRRWPNGSDRASPRSAGSEGVRSQAAPNRHFPAVDRSVVRGEGR